MAVLVRLFNVLNTWHKSLGCGRNCMVSGEEGCWGLRVAVMGHRYFAADPIDTCTLVLHKYKLNNVKVEIIWWLFQHVVMLMDNSLSALCI